MEIFRGVTCLQLNSECFSKKKKKKFIYRESTSVYNIFGIWVKEMQGSLYQLLKFFYKSEIISK